MMQGWIACGGESGLLKVLKLEALSTDVNSKSRVSSNISAL